jgi:Putative auto-transporter adhesin, head GIN domain
VIRTLALAALLLATPAFAAERGFSVTDFDRIEVDGAFEVSVETGKSPSARASGSANGIDQVQIEVRGRTLRIRPLRLNWGGWPGEAVVPPKIRIGVPGLRDASLRGSGALSITKMRAGVVRLLQVGSGQMSVAAIEADQLFANQSGSGLLTLGGKALVGKLTTDGSGQLAGGKLAVTDLTLTSRSAGTGTVIAVRSAKVVSSGSGEIVIIGSAACSVTATGAGTVRCGK